MSETAPQARLQDFVVRSAMLIDDYRLDEWLACFDEAASYIVVPRDNDMRGLPGALIHCENKARLVDRIVCLQTANKVNPHYDRHIMSGSLIVGNDAAIFDVRSNFMVVQTNLTGMSKLFCAGCYVDKIRLGADGEDRIVQRRVVVDTFSVPTMLATPL